MLADPSDPLEPQLQCPQEPNQLDQAEPGASGEGRPEGLWLLQKQTDRESDQLPDPDAHGGAQGQGLRVQVGLEMNIENLVINKTSLEENMAVPDCGQNEDSAP